MNDTLYLLLAFIAGLALGTIFFGGLWLTVKKAFASKIPALWFFSSFLVRIGITLFGFYYISIGSWQRLIICVLGFVSARFIVIYVTKSLEQKHLHLNKEITDEA